MNLGKLVFAQLTQHLPLTTFRRCVARYGGEHKVKAFSCLDQYLCMAFAQLTYRESLRNLLAIHSLWCDDLLRSVCRVPSATWAFAVNHVKDGLSGHL